MEIISEMPFPRTAILDVIQFVSAWQWNICSIRRFGKNTWGGGNGVSLRANVSTTIHEWNVRFNGFLSHYTIFFSIYTLLYIFINISLFRIAYNYVYICRYGLRIKECKNRVADRIVLEWDLVPTEASRLFEEISTSLPPAPIAKI